MEQASYASQHAQAHAPCSIMALFHASLSEIDSAQREYSLFGANVAPRYPVSTKKQLFLHFWGGYAPPLYRRRGSVQNAYIK